MPQLAIDWAAVRGFGLAEFLCQCHLPVCDAVKAPSPRLVSELVAVRADVGGPIIIASGIRCVKHNVAVGGEPDSAHLTGEAVDLRCSDAATRARLLGRLCRSFQRVGIGRTFLHVDVADRPPAIWLYPSTITR